jgi:hypothetical protein
VIYYIEGMEKGINFTGRENGSSWGKMWKTTTVQLGLEEK